MWHFGQRCICHQLKSTQMLVNQQTENFSEGKINKNRHLSPSLTCTQ
uniref:Uncharacterized protein n=1 Tax=Anguilla anguilla TaxID=7936 RepID=A0A0E9X0L4_ANGAN